mmetsp:Transcript_7395/g.14825  ORF Transcript_7395/g.14825 Transcript_7395/m.14825 type:complete len:312 (+) Transcript_7395:351-1286(+)
MSNSTTRSFTGGRIGGTSSLHMSSSSSDEEELSDRIDRAYTVLDIAGLLRSSHPKWQHMWFSQAVQELTAILSHDAFWKSAPKSLRYRVEDDVSLAIEKADWDRDRILLGHMVKAMNRQKLFSKKKRAAIFSMYRSYSILASRRIKKNNNHRKTELQFIPEELLGLIFKGLDPKSLVQCALVCTHWKRVAFDDSLWEPMLIKVFGRVALKHSSGDGKARFASLASHYPAMLLPYETKRVCIHNYVRTMNEHTWLRLIETPQDHGICARAARSTRTPMFLQASEVALWLTNPCEATLSQFRRAWKAYTHTLS